MKRISHFEKAERKQVPTTSCTVLECGHRRVQLSIYQPQHTRDACRCSEIQADTSKISRIFKNSNPLILSVEDHDEITDIRLVASQPDLAHVAIVHLSVDGLGDL